MRISRRLHHWLVVGIVCGPSARPTKKRQTTLFNINTSPLGDSQNILKGYRAAVRCCALLCVAVRCLCSGLEATHTHSSPRRGLPPKPAPCKISSKHKHQSRFRATTARAGHGHPRRRMTSSAARKLDLSTAGFYFRSSTSSATGLNPSNFRRAFRMRRVGSHTGRLTVVELSDAFNRPT